MQDLALILVQPIVAGTTDDPAGAVSSKRPRRGVAQRRRAQRLEASERRLVAAGSSGLPPSLSAPGLGISLPENVLQELEVGLEQVEEALAREGEAVRALKAKLVGLLPRGGRASGPRVLEFFPALHALPAAGRGLRFSSA